MKKGTLFLLENTHHTVPYKKNYFFFDIHFSFYNNTLVFVSLQRSKASFSFQWCLLFTQEIPNEIILLYSIMTQPLG